MFLFLIDHSYLLVVATGFPAGQTPLQTRLEEIRIAVENGASEIDVVINRQFALSGNWKGIGIRTARSLKIYYDFL